MGRIEDREQMTIYFWRILWAFGLTATLSAIVMGRPTMAQPIIVQPTMAQPTKEANERRMEASFELSDVTGNPFDDAQNAVRVKLRLPDGKSVAVPAFFDGGMTWRVRWTPILPGEYVWSEVTRNAKTVAPTNYTGRETIVQNPDRRGFIRLKEGVFRFENNLLYYPLGHNVAWGGGAEKTVADTTARFEKMGKAGENWSRVWMSHWDGKNLDWKVSPGEIDLEAARRWDNIVEAAERNGIHFQMVLQHHGPYSSTTDSNWGENSWNAKNGGFLSAPEDFFTSEKARAATRAKFRYIVARYGYSPAILAWELFNEVEWTDGARKHPETVAAWHREMGDVLRKADFWKHLVTTSSTPKIPGIYETMDYLQPHRYQSNPIALGSAPVDKELPKRPAFLGEFGASAQGTGQQEGEFLTVALFASLMHDWQGAAQYWYWDRVDKDNLYPRFAAVSAFLKDSDLPNWQDAHPLDFKVETKDAGELTARPGRGFDKTERTEFEITPDGDAIGFAEMPSFLQGDAHREMFPNAVIRINAPQEVTFTVRFGRVAKAGAKLLLEKDGAKAEERDFPASNADADTNSEFTLRLSPGAHSLRLTNTGADWITLREIHVTPIGPTLRTFGKANKTAVAGFVYRSSATTAPTTGTLVLPTLAPGRYRVIWRDAATGAPLRESEITATTAPLRLTTPLIAEAAAFYLRRR